MSNLYKRRVIIMDKQRENPRRREDLLELSMAADSFRRANEELKSAQRLPFSENDDLRIVPPTLVPSALRERARGKIRTIAERMKR